VIGRIRERSARGLLAPLLAYSLPIGCYLITILAEKQRRNGKRIANHSPSRYKEDSKNKQRNGKQSPMKQQRISKQPPIKQ